MTSRPSPTRYQTNTAMECRVTNRSSQAIEAYPTTKLTTVPTRVAPQPTVDAMSLRALIASSPPAAASAGMPRKNASRVAVSRFRSRSRPAEMVAPDRDTPGIRANTWATPMKTPSRTLTELSSRRWVPARSAKTSTPLQRISAMATTHRLRSGPSMKLLAARPTTAIGSEPTITASDSRHSGSWRARAENSPRKNAATIETMSFQK
jgi:hypothetical protein